MTEYLKQDDVFLAYDRAPVGTDPIRTYSEFQRFGKDWSGKTLAALYNTTATAQGKNVKDICPSLEGGKNQQPAAFSPKTGLFYVPTNNLRMDFEGREVVYGFGELDELVLAYATTIHKSQGSEYPAVVIPLAM